MEHPSTQKPVQVSIIYNYIKVKSLFMMQVTKRVIDSFDVRDPSVSSILITISVGSNHFTKVTELDYVVPLKGIKSDTKEIHIIRSFSPRMHYIYK